MRRDAGLLAGGGNLRYGRERVGRESGPELLVVTSVVPVSSEKSAPQTVHFQWSLTPRSVQVAGVPPTLASEWGARAVARLSAVTSALPASSAKSLPQSAHAQWAAVPGSVQLAGTSSTASSA